MSKNVSTIIEKAANLVYLLRPVGILAPEHRLGERIVVARCQHRGRLGHTKSLEQPRIAMTRVQPLVGKTQYEHNRVNPM